VPGAAVGWTARERWLLVSVPAVLLPQVLWAIAFLLARLFGADDTPTQAATRGVAGPTV